MLEADVHFHPENQSCDLYGQKLEAGDTVQPGDFFDSFKVWAPCSASILGKTVAELNGLIIIRPMPL